MINTSLSPSKNHAPRITGLLFALLMSVICFPAFAQTAPGTSCEKELERLMAQRDKEIASAVNPIQKRFELATQQLLRKALQTGDLEAANKLKAMIDQAGGAAGENKVNDDKNMVRVEGGTLPKGSAFAGQGVPNFAIGKCEVTWSEWKTVRTWAAANGYDIGTLGSGIGDNYPVIDVQWYDVVKWCNAKSEMEGLAPVYSYNGTVLRTGGWQILGSDATDNIVNDANKNGYRLPTISEWEWAARGGISTKGYTYSGGNDANLVAWYSANSGNATHAVGTKAPNELGIYDMSGNAMEWCWDRRGIGRCARGGTWNLSSESLANNQLGVWLPSVGNFWDNLGDFGFRLARSSGN